MHIKFQIVSFFVLPCQFADLDFFTLYTWHFLGVILFFFTSIPRYQMMLKCWETDPSKRPKMAENHQQLESSILSSLPSLEAVDESETLPRNERLPTAPGSTNLQEEHDHVTSSDMY